MPPKRHLPQKRACDVCYRKKIQCSLPNPNGPCEWCAFRGLECTFDRQHPRKKRHNSDVQNLLQRIQQLEGALTRAEPTTASTGRDVTNSENQTTPGSSSITPGGDGTAPEISLSPMNFAQTSDYVTGGCLAKGPGSTNQIGPNWYFNGIPISSEAGCRWISTRTGQNITMADFSVPITAPSLPSALRRFSLQEASDLPDKEAVRETISAFFRSPFRLSFPVLDETLFEFTLEAAYERIDGALLSPTQVSARACVLGAISILSGSNASRQMSVFKNSDIYAAKAHCLLLHGAENNSLWNLQTALMLQLQCVFRADWQGAAFFQSITCRIVYALRGHLYQPPQPSEIEISLPGRENNHTRILFWLCYMLDKDISLCIGTPPLLTDIYCDLDIPDNYFEYYTYLPHWDTSSIDADEANRYLIPHLPGDPHLSHLKEKVYRQLFSVRAMKDNNNQRLLNIRQLDNEIEEWRQSIPDTFRPAIFVSQHHALPGKTDEATPHIIRRIALQLEYHHVMTVVHTTVRKCTTESSDENQDLHSVVHSSFDLSLAASRSTLWCLRILISTIAEDSFQFITFYSSIAAMSLFLNIIIHPLDSESRLDLELLISSANIVQNIPAHALTQNEVTRVQEIGSFMMRLVWLGTCAMTKAEKDKRDKSDDIQTGQSSIVLPTENPVNLLYKGCAS
ncbi:hypothetical protein BO71DRAFT_360203 [Aspergillus ellipticus CBS 707.79]|uniref:Zn(2)-C6 fungal-type domain-containing protein n=1 Tax=Aspergillus ellipticus CBS 707.79 TaxID=1448320 RepID=A0A319DSJ4_9EURO|nr:hypothetical protein BO71DRAFT_360203 [Aspergillus ellipticus CBS 707.79]